eukprot:scaffold87036_cov17-Tisochrysis_lutea.AAC.1
MPRCPWDAAIRSQTVLCSESKIAALPFVPRQRCPLHYGSCAQGDATLSLSCSDKIARWCCLGVQGCLLSALIEPLYLTSLVVSLPPDLEPTGGWLGIPCPRKRAVPTLL